jgi:tetratricopeptide (TPR) repeat protein
MPSLFSSRRRKQRRVLYAEAEKRGVAVEELPNVVPRKELWALVNSATPDIESAFWYLPSRTTLDDRPSSGVPAVEAAVAAAAGGDWEPAAEVLAESYGDWDLRALAVEDLAAVTANDDGWLVTWQTARPGDGHAAVVDCTARRALAWQFKRAGQLEDFRRVLRDTEPVVERALLAMPDDPTAWVEKARIAWELGYDHAEFEWVWQALVERAPLHRRGHEAALAYWTAWASRERGFAFAQEAAERSPSLNVLVVRAAVSLSSTKPRVWRRPEARAALDASLAWLTGDGADSVNVRDDLGLAAVALVETGRGAEAVELFRRLGRYAGGEPFRNSPVPVAVFSSYRERACKLANGTNRRMGAQLWGRSVRYMANLGPEAFTSFAPRLHQAISRRPSNAYVLAPLLTHVLAEQRQAARYDVVVAVARVAVDICRPRGADFEAWLSDALGHLAFSRQQLGEPALEEAEEVVEILARHQPNPRELPAYGAALIGLARGLSRAGRHEEAVDTAHRATALERQLNGVNLLAALSCLREVLNTAGQADEAHLVNEELEQRAAARPPA